MLKESTDLFHLINQTSRQFSKAFNEKFVPSGLYLAQWTVLRYLHLHGSSSQVQMSSYLNVEAPTMTRTLARLEKLGLIERKEGQDRRQKLIQLTPLALKKAPVWLEEVQSFTNPIYNQISEEELQITLRVLTKLQQELKQ